MKKNILSQTLHKLAALALAISLINCYASLAFAQEQSDTAADPEIFQETNDDAFQNDDILVTQQSEIGPASTSTVEDLPPAEPVMAEETVDEPDPAGIVPEPASTPEILADVDTTVDTPLLPDIPQDIPGPCEQPDVLATEETSTTTASSTIDDLAEQQIQPQDQAEGCPIQGTDQTETDTDINNLNDAIVENEVIASSTTGKNEVASADQIEDTAVQTGDINVYANVLNVVNTNLVDSKITELAQNFDSLSADLFLNDPGATGAELAQDLVTKICTDVECKSLSSFTLTNQNLAAVQNDIAATGDSGGNSIASGDDVKDSSITTGDVNAVVNVLNIVNSNLVNSRWTFASINIFGSWQGDLVLPSELYFSDYMTVGQAGTAAADIEDIKKVVLDAQNNNQAVIVNDVSTQAESGNNGLEATEDEEGHGGDIHDSTVQTGQTQSADNVQNFANTNIVNTRWYLNLVNTLGNWSGNIYSLPDQVVMSPTAGGLSFFSTTSNNNNEAYRAFAEAMAEATASTSTSTLESETDINDQNCAVIANDIDVSAQTGNNGISGIDVKRSKILTGNAKALANIINFANTNLIGSDLQVGLVNIFGDWTGNIVFGFPDLTVSQSLLSPAFPKEKNQKAEYEINYANLQHSSISNTVLEWQYDPAEMMLMGPLPSFNYTMPHPGAVQFDLGKIPALGSGKLHLRIKTLMDVPEGTQISNYARIWGLGPERDKSNNESFLKSFATTTVFGGGNNEEDGAPTNNNNGSGGGSGGGSSRTNLLRVYKTNSSPNTSLQAGNTITFRLVADNDGTNQLFNVIIHDALRGPDNNVIQTRTFELGDMMPMEEVAITYELEVTAEAGSGQYTNTAFAEGLDAAFNPVRSELTAISSFTVSAFGGGQSSASSQGNNASTTQENLLITTPTSTPLAETIDDDQDIKPFVTGMVKGSKTQHQTNPANNPPPPFSAIAGSAGAEGFDENIFSPLAEGPNANESLNDYSIFDRGIGIIFICFLIALGYATANLVRRNRLQGSDEIDLPAGPMPEPEPKPEPPIFKIKKITARKNTARLKKNLDIEI